MASHLRLLRADVSTAAPQSHSLRSDEGLEAVVSLMATITAGGRLDRLGVIAQEHLSTGGKRMRARLCLATAAALGVDRTAAVPWATAIELLHNATLVHDDIQDGDLIRRGQPTVWVRHGVAQAINAGDLMLMLPFLALDQFEDLDDGVRWRLSRALARHAALTVRGQSEELALLSSGQLSRTRYRRAVEGKTGSLFALPVEGAALLAGWSAEDAQALGERFTALGVLFQLQDDVVDLYGDKGRGHRGSDLEEGKVSALVLAHLDRVPEDKDWLLGLLAAPRDVTGADAVNEAIRRFRASGALGDVLDEIRNIGETLAADPLLRSQPALAQVAEEVRRLALHPIAHLLS
jgi:geranylgeranyl diphosphate synthase type I